MRDKITSRQQAKDQQLLTASIARIKRRAADEKIYGMAIQTLQATIFLFGADSPEYKLAWHSVE